MSAEQAEPKRMNFYDLKRGDRVDLGHGKGWETVEGWSEGSSLVGGIRLHTDVAMHGWPEGREPPRSHTVLAILAPAPEGEAG